MNYGNNILIDFRMLFDIDGGLFKQIKESFNNPTYINQDMLDMSDKNFIYAIIMSKVYDPLKILLNDDYKDSSLDLLQQFMEEDYKSIVNYSEPTSILQMIIIYLKTKLIGVTVWCRDFCEKDFIESSEFFKGYKISTIVENDSSKINIEGFDSIFIKHYNEIIEFTGLEGKSVFLGNYQFNLEDDNKTPLKDISILIGDVNRIYVIDTQDISSEEFPIY